MQIVIRGERLAIIAKKDEEKDIYNLLQKSSYWFWYSEYLSYWIGAYDIKTLTFTHWKVFKIWIYYSLFFFFLYFFSPTYLQNTVTFMIIKKIYNIIKKFYESVSAESKCNQDSKQNTELKLEQDIIEKSKKTMDLEEELNLLKERYLQLDKENSAKSFSVQYCNNSSTPEVSVGFQKNLEI